MQSTHSVTVHFDIKTVHLYSISKVNVIIKSWACFINDWIMESAIETNFYMKVFWN